jgi:hypothetical protein
MGLVVSATPWPLYARERDPEPILQEGGWILRAGLDGRGKIRPTGIRSPDRAARSELLY